MESKAKSSSNVGFLHNYVKFLLIDESPCQVGDIVTLIDRCSLRKVNESPQKLEKT